jgi:hypothetical protein
VCVRASDGGGGGTMHRAFFMTALADALKIFLVSRVRTAGTRRRRPVCARAIECLATELWCKKFSLTSLCECRRRRRAPRRSTPKDFFFFGHPRISKNSDCPRGASDEWRDPRSAATRDYSSNPLTLRSPSANCRIAVASRRAASLAAASRMRHACPTSRNRAGVVASTDARAQSTIIGQRVSRCRSVSQGAAR